MGNRERLVEYLKDNDVCRECKTSECSTCWAHRALCDEADSLIAHGVFAPKLKVGDIVYFVYWDSEDDDCVVISGEKVIDVSVNGFTLTSVINECDMQNADFYKWDELDSGGWFYSKLSDAENKKDEILKAMNGDG